MKKMEIGIDTNIGLGLCYLFPILSLIFILIGKEVEYEVRFHLWQSFFLGIAVGVIGGATCGIGFVLWVYNLFLAIQAFRGLFQYRVPGISILVEKVIGPAV